MVDIVSRTGEFESVSTEERASCDGLLISPTVMPPPPGIVKVDTVIGENRMDFVGYGRDKMAKELGGNLGGRFLMSSRRTAGAIDGDKEMELAFFGPHFGNVDVEEADRVGCALLLRRLAPLDIWQLADAVALQTTMQRRSRQMRDARLQRIQAIIERISVCRRKDDNDRLVFDRKNRRFRFFRTGRRIGLGTLRHLARLRINSIALGKRPQALLTMLYRSTDRLCRCGAPM